MKDPNWRKCILHADSKTLIKRIPDNSIDFILTDPPYNLSQHSTGNIPLPGRAAMNNDVAEWDKLIFNPEEWADDFVRILKPTGNLFIFTSYHQIGRWYNCLDSKFDTTNFMVWHKTNPAPKIFKAGFLNSCEMVLTCWNKKHTWNFISQKEMHNFIESPICMRPERLSDPKHPTQKPVAILKKMIEIASNKDNIVFDPFMGVGSTGVAAIELGRRFIGAEIDLSYFEAARKRIEASLKQNDANKTYTLPHGENEDYMAHEPSCDTLAATTQLKHFFYARNVEGSLTPPDRKSELPPIIKWPGGKEKELKYIIPNLPDFQRYVEPFVGGGSVFMGINAKEYHINDFSSELIQLYKCIATSNTKFYQYAEDMDATWKAIKDFFLRNKILVEIYQSYQKELIDERTLKERIHLFCENKKEEIHDLLKNDFASLPNTLLKEVESNLVRKMRRMRVLETQKNKLPEKDLEDNIETALKSAVYMCYRNLYNDKLIASERPMMHCALFFFMRNYAYSGMFRYSGKGDFNVPYGGMAYNSKMMAKKLDYYRSPSLLRHFEKTHVYNLDFEPFMRGLNLEPNDFVFLDPPYDSDFNTYAQKDFTQEDQKRLARYLLNECPAKWMMVIKNTDFIYNLYHRPNINIKTFEKEYLVSFMNRNDKKATHLLITNY